MARTQNIYDQVGTDHLGAWEPKQQHRFICTLYFPPLAGIIPGVGSAGYVAGANRKLIALVKAAKRPDIDVGGTPTVMNFIHEQAQYAGKPVNAKSIQLDFRDALGVSADSSSAADTMGTLYAWTRLVYDPLTGTMGFKSEYQGQMLLELLTPHGDVCEAWTMQNVWPATITGSALQYESAGELACTINFNYDKAYYGNMLGGFITQ